MIIRDLLIESLPYAIINDMYSTESEIAVFNLWDSDYIPECLEPYIQRPPNHQETVEALNERILEVISEKDYKL